MTATEWFRGVPWEPQALTAAARDRQAEATTEVARGFIEARKHDPSHQPDEAPFRVVRGDVLALVSAELVVVGYGRPSKALSAPSDTRPGPKPRRAKGRGPKDYPELFDWLADEGYQVINHETGRHPYVLSPTGVRLVTFNGTPSDHRSFKNDVAACRRILGIALRRQQ